MNCVIFSGTSEGHALCARLSARGIPAEVYVATEYGRTVMQPMRGITVHAGRLSQPEMAQRMTARTTVVDATHPYAAEVSANIRAACAQVGCRYLRLIRPRTPVPDAVHVKDAHAAAQYLNTVEGKVLLTVGSKELHGFTAVEHYAERLTARVLPVESSLKICQELGFPAKQLILMQGPFSTELNAAMLRAVDARWLVTKDTGAAGGLPEKLEAARKCGVKVLLIDRPAQESGHTLDEIEELLAGAPPRRFPLFVDLRGKRCLVVGAGKIGLHRAEILRRYGARVTLLALHDVQAEGICFERRAYTATDSDGCFLVVAATQHRAVNHEIYLDCMRRGIPVSVADCRQESTFFFPALCEGEAITVGLVSDGTDHALTARTAKRIRSLLKGGNCQ